MDVEEEAEINSSEFLEINHKVTSESDDDDDDDESEGSLFSIEIKENCCDRVFVAVGKDESSMNALMWTLKHAITPYSTVVHLIHVFPAIRLIPSPLGGGMLPKSQACSKMVEIYVAQLRDKRMKLLQTYIDACSAAKVKVKISLVEGDITAEAILELIPTLNIGKLVLGSNKSSIRKVKSKKGTARQVIQNAPETCEIKIVCKGKELIDQSNGSPSPHGSNANSSSTQRGRSRTSIRLTRYRTITFIRNVNIRQVWGIVLKWVREKTNSTLASSKPQPGVSALYHNLLK